MANYSDAAIIRAVLLCSMHGQLVENVYHLRAKNAGIPDNEIAATVRDKIWNQLSPNFSGELSCQSITVQEIFPTPTDPFELAVGTDGGQEGQANPSSVAVVVALKTGFGGRRNRGRKYHAGLLQTETEDSRIEPVRLAALQADYDAINSWFAAGNGLSNLTWGVLHRSNAGAPVPLGADSYVAITSAIVRAVLGTMRTRIPGHGN